MTERYNVLQKKLEDLDHVHQEGKKAHQAETERLRSELARCQKALAEQTDRAEKQRKHGGLLDSRVQDLKKAALADQAEIKALKAKLKTAENDKNNKQSDIQEMKTTMQTAESRYRDGLRERDRKIAGLERSLASEIKRRESLETKLQDIRSKGDNDVLAARNGAKQTESQLTSVQQELSATRASFAQEREQFIARLAHRSHLLSEAAEQYGRLASTTVPSSTHNKLKRLHNAAEVRVLRLERKLGNAEDQVKELANLIRQVNDHNDLLKAQLGDANTQISIYENMFDDTPFTKPLLFAYTCVDKELTQTSLEAQITTLKNQQKQTELTYEAANKKDKDAVQRLTSTVQRSRVAEDALRAEIDSLLTELADAERYQEAYNSLSEEVNALLARNQLAEEEAERLSKFNAEILGHNNPAQRIAYVDRIRRELAEAKHKIILLSREQENVVTLNVDLQHELDMYKSVMTSDKPRTHITRVQRVPLSNVTRSLNNPTQQHTKPTKPLSSNLDPIPREMTLDEIM
ncbi:hypothetical protein AN958_03897 [Leucoagaricus sp. SymC.cos]|nr:hypothetical protein AN958_03897 [Leucoagaricus sp. SymC.cos]